VELRADGQAGARREGRRDRLEGLLYDHIAEER
jgi:hypothetical protein